MIQDLLEDAYVKGINIIGTLATGILSLEDILEKVKSSGITSKEAERMIENGIKILGIKDPGELYSDGFQKKLEELEERKFEYSDSNNIIKILEENLENSGEIRIWRKEEIEKPPEDLPIPIAISYDERVKKMGKVILFELAQDRAILVIHTIGTTYEVKLTKNDLPREYFLVKGLRVLLIYKDGNEIISEDLEITPRPSWGKIRLTATDPLGIEIRSALYSWILSKGLHKKLSIIYQQNPLLLASGILDDKIDISEHLTKEEQEMLEKVIEFYRENKDDLAYKVGILLKVYNAKEIAEILNIVIKPKVNSLDDFMKFAKDAAAIYGRKKIEIYSIPENLAGEYRKILRGIYETLAKTRKIEGNGSSKPIYLPIPVPTIALWRMDLVQENPPKVRALRFGYEPQTEIRVTAWDDSEEKFL